jgi:hypothetical protein
VFRSSFGNVTAIARDSLCNQQLATGSARCFVKPCYNVTAIMRIVFATKRTWPLEAPSVMLLSIENRKTKTITKRLRVPK